MPSFVMALIIIRHFIAFTILIYNINTLIHTKMHTYVQTYMDIDIFVHTYTRFLYTAPGGQNMYSVWLLVKNQLSNCSFNKDISVIICAKNER